ncbi:hypothetical protein ACIGXM_11815 [Kitasatospora sp. NPDC052896]|uniref:hypothetical protein n=1 Tax=Kitasatospora sp. NPDC052896 TaxID=3364061 RepID=UPI0037C6091B
MTDPSPLFVPVHLDALVVNDQVRLGENFQRWQANYTLTRSRLSPEPPPFGNIDTDFAITPDRNGVYLQWQLPQALTNGTQDHPDSDISFPLVPNRWLVVRTHGLPGAEAREQTAWLVESDHLDPVGGTSPYATPDGTITRIGRRINLSAGASWNEPGPPAGGLFLTAVGPGVPTFAVYQPYNEDVFSIHDTMDGLDPTREWTVGYLVAGWYSDPSADPVTEAGPELRKLLTEFDWTLTPGPETDPEDPEAPVAAASRGIFHGTVLGLSWHGTGPSPTSPRPDLVAVALGHTSAHASLVFEEEAEPEDAPGLAELLNTCQRGLLEAVDEPDGAFVKGRATFESWFVPTPAGYTWTLEADPDAPEEPARARRRARRTFTDLLATLNADQAAHDEAARDLAAAQRRVYDLWWAEGLPVVPEFDPDEVLEDGAYRGELGTRLRAAEEEAARCQLVLDQARERIPWGRTQDELADSITEHFAGQTSGFVLKREVLPDLYRATEPVVALRCTKEDQQARLAAEDGLLCRRAEELVCGVYLDPARTVLVTAPASAIPVPPNLPNAPAELPRLLHEFFYLDPANARALARAAGRPDTDAAALREAMADPATRAHGLPPALGTTEWRQAWSPLFFQWEIDYYPITYAEGQGIEDPEQANWTFDGNRYRWNGTGADHEPLTLRGRQFLTPTPAQTLADSLRHAAADRSGPYAELLRTLADQAAEADLISQTLNGFNDQLLARSANEAVHLGGGSRVRDAAIGGQIAQGLPPDPGPLPRPFIGWAASRFQEVRSGQFAFTRLNVVDRFGRGLPVVIPDEIELRDTIGQGTPAHAFRPGLPHDLSPGTDEETGELVTVVDRDPGRFVELKPRLPQPARTRLSLLSADADAHVLDDEAAAASICAWLVPNHLDQAVLCYAADGSPLGSVAISVMPDGTTVPRWQPLPGSIYRLPGDLAADHGHLHDLVTGLLDLDRTTLRTFLRGIDRALTTIAPTGDQDPPTTLSRLLGRPLALVRARVRLDLDGSPYRDPSWQHLLEPSEPEYPNYRWPVRLGERDELGDGLVGYYQERDYTGLHIVLDETDLADLDDQHDYLRPIGPGNGLALPARPPRDHDPASTAHLTLLLDPFGAVHATTGILPTAQLRVPARAFEESLGAIAAGFRFGPMFTIEAPDDAALILPRPADRHGTWTWAQPAPAGAWADPHPTDQADPLPRFPFARPVLRTGYLQLQPSEEGPTP